MASRSKSCGRCGIPVHGEFCLDCRAADKPYFQMVQEAQPCPVTTGR